MISKTMLDRSTCPGRVRLSRQWKLTPDLRAQKARAPVTRPMQEGVQLQVCGVAVRVQVWLLTKAPMPTSIALFTQLAPRDLNL